MRKFFKLFRLQIPIRIRLTLIFTALLMVALVVLGFGLYFIVSQTLNERLEANLKSTADFLLGDQAHQTGAPILLPGPLLTQSEPANNDTTTQAPNVTSDPSTPSASVSTTPTYVQPTVTLSIPITPSNGPPISDHPQVISELQVNLTKLSDSTLIFDADEHLLAAPTEGLKNTPALAHLAHLARGLPEGGSHYSQLSLVDYTNNNISIEPFLVYARPIYSPVDPNNSASQTILVGVYVDTRKYSETKALLGTMYQFLLIALPVALLLSLGVGGLVAGRALRPIKNITAAARQIGATDLSRRIGLTSHDELGQLAQTFDAMIGRLEASFSRQRRFVADASHELRTPLSVIEAEATLMLKRERELQDYQQALQLITLEAGRMRNLIEDMLLLAKADSGELELLPQLIALDDLVTEAVERINVLARQRNQHLYLEVAGEIWLEADPTVLMSLFFNLLSNAVKYTPPGGSIWVRIKHPNPTEATVEVQDSGPGIAPEHLPHLFDRFYQVDRARQRHSSVTNLLTLTDSTVSPSGSSGLGLSIAQWAAHSHGGRIMVQSRLGEGSIFEVTLPVALYNGGELSDG